MKGKYRRQNNNKVKNTTDTKKIGKEELTGESKKEAEKKAINEQDNLKFLDAT